MTHSFSLSRPLGIVGTGAVGSAFARVLHDRGLPLMIWNRTAVRAIGLARHLDGRVDVAKDLEELVAGTDALLVCVADNALDEVAAALAATEASSEASSALHVCGGRGTRALSSLEALSWSVGVLHPLVPIPRAGDVRGRAAAVAGAQSLLHSAYGVRAEGQAMELARMITAELSGRVLELPEDPGTLARYHAAAALVSNGSVALFAAGEELLGGLGLDPEASRWALASLLIQTAKNLEMGEPRDVLTGPVARGDAALLERHRRALDEHPELLNLYRTLVGRMAQVAGHDDELRARLLAALS